MQDVNNLTELETRVYQVTTKNYKTLMLAPDAITLINKNVSNAQDFEQALEKGGLLSAKTRVTPDSLKSITVEKGESKMSLNSRKMLELGGVGELEFSSESNLNEVLDYIEKKWFFQRTEKPLSSFKAIVPYLIGLAITIFATGFVIYINTVGGSYRANIIFILLVKLSGVIGFIPTILLGLLIGGIIVRELWKAYKNPPIEIRLESMA